MIAFLLSAVLSFDFKVLPLGVDGGLNEASLTSFALSVGEKEWMLLDAGSVFAGLREAERRGELAKVVATLPPSTLNDAERFIRDAVVAVAITHPHLDHVQGLAINVVDDRLFSFKPLLAIAHTINVLADDVFNWRVWPNFLSLGTPPALSVYDPQLLDDDGNVHFDLSPNGLPVTVRAFRLCHSACYPSTAFLIEHPNDASLAYLGDTGPDNVEADADGAKPQRLRALWRALAPKIAARRLTALFIECSYAANRSDSTLFGHLTPFLVAQELRALADEVAAISLKRASSSSSSSSAHAPLHDLNVVITHVKLAAEAGVDAVDVVRQELARLNRLYSLDVRFIFPVQGAPLYLSTDDDDDDDEDD